MKILITADTVGGVWTYAMELTRELSARDVDVSLATMGRPLSREQRADIRRSGCLAVFESDFKLEWMDNPWNDVRECGEWLARLERDLSPDVVHLNQYCFGALPWRAPVLIACHSCVLSWWLAVKGESAPPRPWALYRAAVSRGMNAANLLVAPTQAMASFVRQIYGRSNRPVVIPNGRSPWLFRPAKKQLLVLAAGRIWDEAKNIAALERIDAALPWPVYVAGDAGCPGVAGEMGILQNSGCTALGPLSSAELSEWMARAAIYCLPARYEPFGLSALEAALSGCALVLGDIPSLRENWDGAALFVRPGDDDALRDALTQLMNCEEKRVSLARRSQGRARHFTAARMASSYLAAYRGLLSRRATRFAGVEESACAS